MALADDAAAWQAAFSMLDISCRVTGPASSATSSAPSHASGSASRAECEEGAADCPSSYRCRAGSCVPQFVEAKATPVAVPEESRLDLGGKCGLDADCAEGLVCSYAICVTQPPSPPSSSLRRRASELYLRARVVELREELALGRGPVINGLAQAEGVPAKELGRALRQHRSELVTLIGDSSDPAWSAKFLTRLEALCARS